MAENVPERKKQRVRSPSYPAIALPEAVQRSETIYAHEGKYLAPVDSIVGHWGYKPGGGSAMRQLAALKKFGLVEDEGSGSTRQIKLSELALDIVMPDSPRRSASLKRAALLPDIHKELQGRWPDGLPSDQTVRFYLVRERAFSEQAATELLAEYRATLEFAGLDDGSNGSGDRDTLGDSDGIETLDDEDTSEDMDATLDQSEQHTAQPKRPRPRHHAGGGTSMEFPLVDDSVVSFSIPTGMTEAAWSQWMTVLNALKPSHVIADPDDE